MSDLSDRAEGALSEGNREAPSGRDATSESNTYSERGGGSVTVDSRGNVTNSTGGIGDGFDGFFSGAKKTLDVVGHLAGMAYGGPIGMARGALGLGSMVSNANFSSRGQSNYSSNFESEYGREGARDSGTSGVNFDFRAAQYRSAPVVTEKILPVTETSKEKIVEQSAPISVGKKVTNDEPLTSNSEKQPFSELVLPALGILSIWALS